MTGAAPHDGGSSASGETRGIIGDIISHHRHLAEEIFHHHGVHHGEPEPLESGHQAGEWQQASQSIAHAVAGGFVHHDGTPSLAAHVAAARASQAPAAEPVITETPEEPVSLASDLKTIASRLETLGEETVTKLETVAATPEGQLAFGALHAIVAAEDPALLATMTTIIGALVPKQGAAPAAASPAPLVTNQG